MQTRSQRALVQMSLVLVVATVFFLALGLWKLSVVKDIFLGDPKPIILNGVIILLFLLGLGQLYRGLTHYAYEERQIARFTRLRSEGRQSDEIFAEARDSSIIADRYYTIRNLFQRGVPIDHSAISAIMVAQESMYQSFPRFVNNVLILTGVFGTVSSLIFALVGAGDVLLASSPDAGMGLLLLGMNTALTTTATAIVCFFFFTYFFHRFTDLQTAVLGRVERAVLLHVVPEFTFETDSVNLQAKLLIEDVRALVVELRSGLVDIDGALQQLAAEARDRKAQTDALIAQHAAQNTRLDDALGRIAGLRDVLVEGFRLGRRD